jgi:hypothetical protein
VQDLQIRLTEPELLSPSSYALQYHAAMQGKNPAVNRIATVVVPSVLGAAAIVMLVNGAHKLYTGQGKLE